jgi:hypothetical protein
MYIRLTLIVYKANDNFIYGLQELYIRATVIVYKAK